MPAQSENLNMINCPDWKTRQYTFTTDQKEGGAMSSEIFKRGKKGVWQARTSYRGVRIRDSLKTIDRKVALERLWETKKLIREGVYQRIKITFDEIALKYDPQTDRENKLRALRLHLNPEFSGKKLIDCEVEVWAERIARDNPQTTANYILRVARELALPVPKDLKYQGMNQWDETQILEESQVLDVIQNYIPKKYKGVCRVAAYSLLRRGDLLALRKRDVDFKKGISIIQQKSKKPVFIPMTDKLKKAFELAKVKPLRADDLWFPRIVPVNLTQATIAAFKKAGIAWGSFHHFRHFGACYLLNAGKPLEVVSKIMGHRSIQTTQIYARVNRETVEKAMTAFDAQTG